jgi:hypothetical protein
MSEESRLALAPVFEEIGAKLVENRSRLNEADKFNGNHGDHMVSIFDAATRAAEETRDQELAASMAYAGSRLALLKDNGSAQVYARGLECVAAQLGERQITLDELVNYVSSVLEGESAQPANGEAGNGGSRRSGEVLKALVAGIAEWNRRESGDAQGGSPLSMGALFDFGIVYLQAKQRGGTRTAIIADTAASVSPLGGVPHRLESGKLVVETLLKALGAQAGDRPRAG